MKYYHVAKNWNGEQLESLSSYLGSETEAIEQFIERWVDADAGFAAYHVNLIHLHASLADAIEYQKRHGGEILEIDEQGDDLEIRIDDLEYPHPVTTYPVDKQYIKKIKI